MNARHALAAVALFVTAATPASATVLSASNQAVGTKASKADYLKVTTVQSELNATIKDVNDAAVANGPVDAVAPNTGEAGYILQKEGDGGNGRTIEGDPFAVRQPDDGKVTGQIGIPGGSRGNHHPNTFDSQRGGRRGGGGGGRHGGGAHAAPEPSTWMLLGAGLALMGGYATLRRRAALES